MIQFHFISHRKIFLTALVLIIVSVTMLVAQNAPSKEATPAESGQVGTFDVKMISFTPWNTSNDSSGLNSMYIPTEGVFIGATGFQVLDDKILFLNHTYGAITVDIKTGRRISSVQFEPAAYSFVWEDGKYFVNSTNNSIDIYDDTGKLERSTSYRSHKVSGQQIVRYNGVTYLIFQKENVDDSSITFDVASLPIYDDGTIGDPFDGAIYQNGTIVFTHYENASINDFASSRGFDTEASFIKTSVGKIFTRNLKESIGDGNIIGFSDNRVFVRKEKTVSENVYKTVLQSFAFDKKNGVGKLMAETEDPFHGFYTDFSILPDGTIYKLFNDRRGALVFSLKEIESGMSQNGFPKNMEIPVKE